MSYKNPAAAIGECRRAGKRTKADVYRCAVEWAPSQNRRQWLDNVNYLVDHSGLGAPGWSTCVKYKRNGTCIEWSDGWKGPLRGSNAPSRYLVYVTHDGGSCRVIARKLGKSGRRPTGAVGTSATVSAYSASTAKAYAKEYRGIDCGGLRGVGKRRRKARRR